MDFFFSVQELLDIEGVLGVIIGGVLVVRVLGQVVFVRKERSDATQLQDALAAIQHRQFIPAHELVAEFLVVGAIAWAIATGIGIVVAVDGFLAECFGKIFQSGGFAATKENLAVHVAHDGIGIVLVDGFQLAAGLQNQTRRDFTAADGSHQFFQLRDLTNVGTLVDKAADMDRQLTAVHIMEKRGSRYLRYALYNATKYVCYWNPVFAKYLAKKRAEGKHYNVVLSHAMKKLVRLIYALQKSGKAYLTAA